MGPYMYSKIQVSFANFHHPNPLVLIFFHLRFTKRTSLLAGGLSWIISAFILLTPVFINGFEEEFGYNENSGSFPVYCEGVCVFNN